MALRTSADNAEDVAAGFRMFRDPLPEYATEITGLIADLYAISVSLKFLDDFASNRAYRHTLHHVQSDLELVGTSLKYTLEDIVDFFGDLETRHGPHRETFKRTWLNLCSYFQEESKDSLSTRLIKYKTFLNELQDEFKEYVDPDTRYSLIHSTHGFIARTRTLVSRQDFDPTSNPSCSNKNPRMPD